MGVLKFFVGCHVLGVRYFSVEGHNWPKGVTFWYEPQLSRRKVVVFAVAIHLFLLNCFQVVLLQIFD